MKIRANVLDSLEKRNKPEVHSQQQTLDSCKVFVLLDYPEIFLDCEGFFFNLLALFLLVISFYLEWMFMKKLNEREDEKKHAVTKGITYHLTMLATGIESNIQSHSS